MCSLIAVEFKLQLHFYIQSSAEFAAIGGFTCKFGGSVRDHHTYMCTCKYEILADFNLAVTKVNNQTAKFNSLPNFPAIPQLCLQCSIAHAGMLLYMIENRERV